MSNELVERINAAVDTAYRGVPVKHHKTLGERLCEAISNWIREDCLEDVLNDIRYARGSVGPSYWMILVNPATTRVKYCLNVISNHE